MSDLVKEYGIKKTAHREEVLKAIENSKIPMTAEDIYNNVKGISLATVYRTIETFLNKGLLNKISVGDDERHYYEIASVNHRHYAVCLKCKHMEYIDVCPVHDIVPKDFEVTGHKLELYGYCKNCREKSG